MKALLVTTIAHDKHSNVINGLEIIPWEQVVSIELTQQDHYDINDINGNSYECCTMRTINLMNTDVVGVIQKAREQLDTIVKDMMKERGYHD